MEERKIIRMQILKYIKNKILKIIIVNYRYFISGGPERYLFNVKDLLEKNGHEVIPFSIKNKRNKPSQYENYFLNPIGEDNEVYFSEYKKTNVVTILKSFSRMFYSFEARKKLNALIKAVNPDLIYVLHYQNKISASIFDAAAKNRIPVIHRISDFGQICANALFFRPAQKDICERCLTGSKFNAISNKCVYDSYVYSTIKVAALKFQEIIGITKKVQAFVVPSKFTIEKLRAHGFPQESLHHIPSFFNFQTISAELPITYEPFALYIGRIEPEKGLLTLVKSFENTEFNLKIIGFSISGFDEELKDYLRDKNHHIEFLGRKGFDEIQIYLSKCSFTVVPSEWYDNFPNTILESFAFKKCTVATNTGSLKELVIDHETGLLFEIKDIRDLKSKIAYLFGNKTICKELGKNAFNMLNNEYSAQEHYTKLNNLFKNVIENYQSVKKIA
jgi:glycosyltransferase involved in cell wall biosynthesis